MIIKTSYVQPHSQYKENKVESKVSAMYDVLQWLCSCNPRAGNNFYGRVLNGCGKTPAPGLKTCMVGLTPDGHYRFVWDPVWYDAQPKAFQILAVIHEVAHLVLKHLERILRVRIVLGDPKKYRELHDVINIAADMAANDTVVRPYANDSSSKAAYKEQLKRLVLPEDREYPPRETFEEYLTRLLNDLEKDGWSPGKPYPQWLSDLAGRCPIPVFDPILNAPLDDMTDAEIERAISTANVESKQLIRDAIKQTQRSRGTIPAHLQELLDMMMVEPRAPWNQIFRGYLRTSLSSKLAESAAYPNPALLHLAAEEEIEPYTGYQKEFTFNMAILIDSSGSINTQDYEMFIGEIQGIAKTEPGATATLVYFDAAVQNVEELTLAPDTLKHPYRYSYGGTDFRPPFQYILGRDTRCDESVTRAPIRKRWDVVIMLTDGEAPIESPSGPCPECLPPCPVIWVLVGNRRPHPAMGSRVVQIG